MPNGESPVPWIVSNAVGLGLLAAAVKRPQAARVLFIVMFLGAFVVNTLFSLRDPSTYLVYGKWAIGSYQSFINGFFSRHITAFVLPIAAGQLAIAGLLAAGGRWMSLGVLGGIVFLLAIAPLGYGSAFPATLLFAAALYVMWARMPAMAARARQ